MQELARKTAASTGTQDANPENVEVPLACVVGEFANMSQAVTQPRIASSTEPLTELQIPPSMEAVTQQGISPSTQSQARGAPRQSTRMQGSQAQRDHVGTRSHQRTNQSNLLPQATEMPIQVPYTNLSPPPREDSAPATRRLKAGGQRGGSAALPPTSNPIAAGSLRGHGGAPSKSGRQRAGQQKTNGVGRWKLTKNILEILKMPPGWMAPTIALENRKHPPILRPTTSMARVVRNLLHAVEAVAPNHGAHRLTNFEEADNCSSGLESPLGT